MSGARTGLLSLPDEILVKILRPLLQHSAADAKQSKSGIIPMMSEWLEQELPGPVIFDDRFHPKSDRLSAQVLRVCKRFNTVATPLLYDNTLIMATEYPSYRKDKNGRFRLGRTVRGIAEEQLRKFSNAKRSDHGDKDGLFKQVVLFVHVKWTTQWFLIAAAELVQMYANTLGKHRKCWEKVYVILCSWMTGSYSDPFCEYEHLGGMVLQHCGAIYAKEAVVENVYGAVAREIKWCIEQPETVKPRKLSEYEDEAEEWGAVELG